MDLKNIEFISYFILCLLIIFMYGSYRCKNPNYKDILETKIYIDDLDGWSLSHLLFFIFIGYQFKENKYLIVAFVFGILWELFEHYYGEKRPGWLGGYGDCDNLKTDRENSNWWYGKYSDIFMNVSGLLIGYYFVNNKLPFKLK
jgi:hypothetical protein